MKSAYLQEEGDSQYGFLRLMNGTSATIFNRQSSEGLLIK
ncbi:hypothetical protein GPLA_2871 [Paraglaciecola polaris LMG 21857]|uniref:Uncharacterized protein n=1 Tax=Paraglaciecola polaris LMG 21857 TaxID=1129793 RepID=K7AEM6_9ALTE|nr:hypothetical protein GPLA_2871 [Paraglaciecola polaris LMG 21857]